MPLAWGRTRLLETDWRLITQESHCFSCGSVKFLPIDILKLDRILCERFLELENIGVMESLIHLAIPWVCRWWQRESKSMSRSAG